VKILVAAVQKSGYPLAVEVAMGKCSDSRGRQLLAAYLKRTGMGRSEFADAAGVGASDLTRYLADDEEKRSSPGLLKAQLIDSATNGAVPAHSWLAMPKNEVPKGDKPVDGEAVA
jgi:hypothetical protein